MTGYSLVMIGRCVGCVPTREESHGAPSGQRTAERAGTRRAARRDVRGMSEMSGDAAAACDIACDASSKEPSYADPTPKELESMAKIKAWLKRDGLAMPSTMTHEECGGEDRAVLTY